MLSYNAKKRTANWVCWQLKKEDIGTTARGAFAPGPDLPKGFAKVSLNPGDRSELKPNAQVFIPGATKNDEGVLEANRITVGKNGVPPPM